MHSSYELTLLMDFKICHFVVSSPKASVGDDAFIRQSVYCIAFNIGAKGLSYPWKLAMLYTLWQPNQRISQEEQQLKNGLARVTTNSLNIQVSTAVIGTALRRETIVVILHRWTLNDNKETINCGNTPLITLIELIS